MEKHILLSGYYGFGNAGDEAVCSAVLQCLRTHGGNPRVTVLSGDPRATERDHGAPAVRRRDLFRILPETDALIQGGGSLLQDATSARSLYYYLHVILAARIIRRPVFLYAQGIGPLRRPSSRAAVRAVLNRVQSITVRDRDSRTLLENLGVTRPPVYVTADPVWALDPAPSDRAALIWTRQGLPSEDKTIGVAMRDWPANPNLDALTAQACSRLQEQGFQPVLLPMQRPADEELAERICERMETPVPVLKGLYVPADLLALVAQCNFVIGMRLHALIFAASRGIPFLGVTYDPKVTSLLGELKAPAPVDVAHLTPEILVSDFHAAWDHRDADRRTTAREVERLRDNALGTARIARDFLAALEAA